MAEDFFFPPVSANESTIYESFTDRWRPATFWHAGAAASHSSPFFSANRPAVFFFFFFYPPRPEENSQGRSLVEDRERGCVSDR